MASRVEWLMRSRDMSKHLSVEPTVQQTLTAASLRILKKAEALLAMHRDTGAHQVGYERIRSEKFGHIDHYVVMTGPAPISVEFGHRTENGKWVEGLYILLRAGWGSR